MTSPFRGIWRTRGKPRTSSCLSGEKRDRVRLSLEQDLNAANDREGHCTTESLREARGLRPVRVQMGRNCWAIARWAAGLLSLQFSLTGGLMSLAGTPCYWIPSVACPGSTSAWRASSFSLRRDPCCGPGWAFRTGSSVWQHRQVAISGGQPTRGHSNPVPGFRSIRSNWWWSVPVSFQRGRDRGSRAHTRRAGGKRYG